MTTVYPDYYPSFSCIAGRCRHTCCKGWEIDIDDASLNRYRHMQGALGQELRENIDMEGGAHFRLGADERCPFLNDKNLCRLILEQGEDCLCQICSDHPRFRNEIGGRLEVGVGLCCEAAADLIVHREAKTKLVVQGTAPAPSDPLERAIIEAREKAIAIVQNRSLSIEERVHQLLSVFEVSMPCKTYAEWAQYFRGLERLDPLWDEYLSRLEKETGEIALPELEIPLEQVTVYFLYRQLPKAQDETDVKGCIGFAALSYVMLRRLAVLDKIETGRVDLAELARLYSSEIEYSDENNNAILDLIYDENCP